MNLGDKVRKRRIELGLTQEELAKRMGYSSRVSINKIENGRQVSQKIIIRLAKALNVPTTYLMDWNESVEMINKDIDNKEAFKQYLKTLDWNIEIHSGDDELIGENEDGSPIYVQPDVYTLSNGTVSFKMSADEFEDMMNYSSEKINQYIDELITKKIHK